MCILYVLSNVDGKPCDEQCLGMENICSDLNFKHPSLTKYDLDPDTSYKVNWKVDKNLPPECMSHKVFSFVDHPYITPFCLSENNGSLGKEMLFECLTDAPNQEVEDILEPSHQSEEVFSEDREKSFGDNRLKFKQAVWDRPERPPNNV